MSQKISRKVFNDAKDKGHTQNPQYGRLSGLGEFVFLRKEGNSLSKVESELSAIEKEMDELKKKMAKSKNKKEQESAQIELQKKEAFAEKKRLEQESLKEIEQKKEAEKKRQAEIQAEYEQNQRKQEEELAKIQMANEEKRKLLEDMKDDTGDIEITINSILETEKAITNIKTNFETARKSAIAQIKEFYKGKYDEISAMKKDKFELAEEFEARKKSELETYQRNEYDELSQINSKYDVEIYKNIKNMEIKLEELKSSVFTMKGGDIKLIFGEYNEDGQFFPGNITYKSKYLLINEPFKIDIASGSSKERREKGMRVENNIKSNSYIGEIEYGIKFDTKNKVWGAFYRKLKVMDITDNSVAMEKQSSEYARILEEQRIAKEKRKQEEVRKKTEEEAKKWKEKHDGIDFVLVQGGSFKNTKSNYYNKGVTVSDFYIGKYEVTQKEWVDVMGSNPSYFKGNNLPVEKVSWYDCVEYCNKRSVKEGLNPVYTIDKNKKDPNNTSTSKYGDIKWTVKANWSANGYRLPTEAEWEYAAAGGQKSNSYNYSGSENIDDVAWYTKTTNNFGTKDVGTKKHNELGIYDMSGNVWEWVQDWDGDIKSGQSDPKGSGSGSYRMRRGGYWSGHADDCRVGDRYSADYPDLATNSLGFRLCRNSK